jgi:transposase-like protein
VDRVDISKVCEEAGVHPSQLYRWQAQLFGSGAAIFERRNPGQHRALARAQERVSALEAKLQKKNEVLSEVMEEHVRLKKSVGES